jgi:hypothetical protein
MRNMRRTLFVLFACPLLLSIVLISFPVRGSSGVILSAWTSAPPTIDGAVDTTSEWADADHESFTIASNYTGTIYVMNDGTNLYVAVEIADNDVGVNFSTRDIVNLYFDNDFDGDGPEDGDEQLSCISWGTTDSDHFYNSSSSSWPWDELNGGANDGESATSGNGTHNFFEISHPLNSTDDLHDFSLETGDTVGFMMRYVDDNTYVGNWPSNASQSSPPTDWHEIRISSSPVLLQGDLVLQGNNITVIEGEFYMNGSIIVEENATLILRNALLNFTQTYDYQYSIILRNPANGNPRLKVENSVITASDHYLYINLHDNSTGSVEVLEEGVFPRFMFRTYDTSILSTANLDTRAIYGYDASRIYVNDTTLWFLHAYELSIVQAANCSIGQFIVDDSASVNILDSTLYYWLDVESDSVNCSINGISSGLVLSWNYILDCSVSVGLGGYAPNVTVQNTQIAEWIFDFLGASNVTVSNSTVRTLVTRETTIAQVSNSTTTWVYTHDSSKTMLVNSTSNYYNTYHNSTISVWWFLDVHVIDSIDQDVPSAHVNASFQNATLAETKIVDAIGRTRLILLEKVMNATGDYPVGNYTVTATYGIYSDEVSVEITSNKEVLLQLDSLIIPEFPSVIIPLLFMTITLLLTIICRKKRPSGLN